jgi:hypothetical protein
VVAPIARDGIADGLVTRPVRLLAGAAAIAHIAKTVLAVANSPAELSANHTEGRHSEHTKSANRTAVEKVRSPTTTVNNYQVANTEACFTLIISSQVNIRGAAKRQSIRQGHKEYKSDPAYLGTTTKHYVVVL